MFSYVHNFEKVEEAFCFQLVHPSIMHNLDILYTQHMTFVGAQWLSGRVLDSRPRGRGFEPHRRHCVVVLEQDTYPSLVLVQPRKTHPCLTERLLMGRKESNQTNNDFCAFLLVQKNAQ